MRQKIENAVAALVLWMVACGLAYLAMAWVTNDIAWLTEGLRVGYHGRDVSWLARLLILIVGIGAFGSVLSAITEDSDKKKDED